MACYILGLLFIVINAPLIGGACTDAGSVVYDYIEDRRNSESPKSWDEAKTACESGGSNFASMKTQAELDELKAHVISVAGANPSRDIYFGLQKSGSQYTWTDDDTAVTWSNWANNEPRKDCAALDVSTWEWVTVNCNSKSGDYICKGTAPPDSGPQFGNLDYSTTIADTVTASTEIVTLTVTDDADDIPNLVTTMTSSSTQFTFDDSTLKLTVLSTPSSGSYSLGFKVVDACGTSSTCTVSITVTNSAPVISSLPATASVKEHVTSETLLHSLVVADSSPSDTVTCSIVSSSPVTNNFILKQSSSVYGVYLKAGASLSFASVSTYDLTIECTDSKDTGTGVLTVNILKNEAPTAVDFQSAVSLPSETTGSGANVLQLNMSDPENDVLTFSMTTSPSGGPFQISSTGLVTTTTALSGITTPSYTLSFTVSDGYNTITSLTTTITITAPDNGPQFGNLDYNTTIADTVTASTEIVTVNVTDDADDIPNLVTTMTTSSSYFAFDNATLKLTVLSPPSSGSYSLGFKVIDTNDMSSTGTVSITVTNSAPVISSLPATASVKEHVTSETLLHPLVVADSSPSDTVTCSIVSSSPVTNNFILKQISSVYEVYLRTGASLNFTSVSMYNLTIECTDTKDTITGILSVNILQNEVPTVVDFQSAVSLPAATTGSGAQVLQVNMSDPENDALTFSMTTSPSGGPFQISSTGLVTTTTALSGIATPSYTLSFTVSDGYNSITSLTTTVTITAPDNGPQFGNLDYNTTITDTVTASTEIVTVNVTDDADDIPNLVTTMTSSSSYFAFDNATLKLTVLSPPSSGSYSLGFKVVDTNDKSSTGTVSITVTNSAPVISSLPATTSVKEHITSETLLHSLVVADSSPSDTVTCSNMSSIPSTDNFVLQNTSGYGVYLRTGASLNFTSVSMYNLTIECTDAKDTVNGILSVNILKNEAPTVVDFQSAISLSATTTGSGAQVLQINITDPENDTLTYSMTTSPSGGPFQISSSGSVTTTVPLSEITTPSYNLTFTVDDGVNTIASLTATITITDINMAPSISNLPFSVNVSENSEIMTQIYQVVGMDTDTPSQTLFYSATFSPAVGASIFNLDYSSGSLNTSSTIDYEVLELSGSTTIVVTVNVSDGKLHTTGELNITVIDMNEAPSFGNTVYNVTGNEGNTGLSYGNPGFSVNDEDTGDSHTFSQSCSQFSIDPTTGNLSLAADYDLDVAGTPDKLVCVAKVSDGELTATATLSVFIQEVNDFAPKFVQSAYSFSMTSDEAVGALLGSVSATDNDIGVYGGFSYSLNQSSLGDTYFSVNSNGDVTITGDTSLLGNGVTLNLSCTVTDTGRLTDTVTLTIVIEEAITTTQATEIKYKTFFMDLRNIAWFSSICVTAIGSFTLLAYAWYLRNLTSKLKMSNNMTNLDTTKLDNNKPRATQHHRAGVKSQTSSWLDKHFKQNHISTRTQQTVHPPPGGNNYDYYARIFRK